MKRPEDMPLSVFLKEVRKILHRRLAVAPDLVMTLDDVLEITEGLDEAATEAALMELRLVSAPPLAVPDNLVTFPRPGSPVMKRYSLMEWISAAAAAAAILLVIVGLMSPAGGSLAP